MQNMVMNAQKVISVVLIIAILFSLSSCTEAHGVSASDFFLDTIVKVTIYDKPEAEALKLIDECFEKIAQYEQIFSAKSITSELYALNNNHGGKASPELLKIIDCALSYSELTHGCFDATIGTLTELWDIKNENVPSESDIQEAMSNAGYSNCGIKIIDDNIVFTDSNARIDLGGIAKGYISDKLYDYLTQNGVKCAIINLGGNVHTVGNKPNDMPYSIGIQNPFSDIGNTITTIQLSDSCAITSGAYQRYFEQDGIIYHHIIDPTTGYPAVSDIASVTVISDNATLSDALSTAFFVMGTEQAKELSEKLDNVRAVIVTSSGEIINCD